MTDDDFASAPAPFALAYQSAYSCFSGRKTVIFNETLCYALYVTLNAMMMRTWLSGATAKASSCVRDLMAVAGSLKRGQQSSDLLARLAQSFILCFSLSIALLVILK